MMNPKVLSSSVVVASADVNDGDLPQQCSRHGFHLRCSISYKSYQAIIISNLVKTTQTFSSFHAGRRRHHARTHPRSRPHPRPRPRPCRPHARTHPRSRPHPPPRRPRRPLARTHPRSRPHPRPRPRRPHARTDPRSRPHPRPSRRRRRRPLARARPRSSPRPHSRLRPRPRTPFLHLLHTSLLAHVLLLVIHPHLHLMSLLH